MKKLQYSKEFTGKVKELHRTGLDVRRIVRMMNTKGHRLVM